MKDEMSQQRGSLRILCMKHPRMQTNPRSGDAETGSSRGTAWVAAGHGRPRDGASLVQPCTPATGCFSLDCGGSVCEVCEACPITSDMTWHIANTRHWAAGGHVSRCPRSPIGPLAVATSRGFFFFVFFFLRQFLSFTGQDQRTHDTHADSNRPAHETRPLVSVNPYGLPHAPARP
jgi:hypothetical protein